MEMLLINHPLDCPICDKGGECPLQNQAHVQRPGRVPVRRGQARPSRSRSRSPPRCCSTGSAACSAPAAPGSPSRSPATRSSSCSSAAPLEQVGTVRGRAVRVLLLRQHHPDLPGRRADLRRLPVPVPAVRPGLDAERLRALRVRLRAAHRRPAGQGACAGWPATTPRSTRSGTATRAASPSPTRPGRPADRAAGPGRATASCVPASWTEALRRPRPTALARGPRQPAASACWPAAGSPSRTPTPTRSSPGSRSAPTTSTSGPGRTRPRSWSSWPPGWPGAARRRCVTYADLEAAPAVLLVGFEPEEESPILFLRLRKAVRSAACRCSRSPRWPAAACARLFGTLLATRARRRGRGAGRARGGRRRSPPSPPERPAMTGWQGQSGAGRGGRGDPGRRAAGRGAGRAGRGGPARRATGARLAWVPRRAGERGAVEAGACPALLPGGRPVADPAARAEVARAWGGLAAGTPGRDTAAMLAAAAARRARRAGGGRASTRRPARPGWRRCARSDGRRSWSAWRCGPAAVTDLADVVLPVAAVAEKAGTFLNWEGRGGSFGAALRGPDVRTAGRARRDRRRDGRRPRPAGRGRGPRANWPRSAAWRGPRRSRPRSAPGGPGVHLTQAHGIGLLDVMLATWQQLLDSGRLQDGEPDLAGTARPAVARMSAGDRGRGRGGGRR